MLSELAIESHEVNHRIVNRCSRGARLAART